MDEIFNDLFKTVQDTPMIFAPVLVVFFGAILVYVLGFKKPVEPQFKKLAAVDSKKDKRKVKAQKSSANGNLHNTEESKTSDSKKKDTTVQNTEQPKSNVTPKKQKRSKKDSSPPAKMHKKELNVENRQAAPKKGKIQPAEKVTDADEGEWMTVTKDKRKKQEEPIIAQASEKDSEQIAKKSKKKNSPGSKKVSSSEDSSPKEKPKAAENKKIKKTSPQAKVIIDSQTAEVAISGELPADSGDSVALSEVPTADVKVDLATQSVNNENDAKELKKTKKKARKE